MGVAGAAWATVIAQAAAFLFGLYYLNKNHEVLRFKISRMTFDKELFSKSVKLGIPSGIQQTLFSFGMMAVQTMVNQYGTDTVAAFGAASRIDSFATMPMMNFGAAISTFVGQNVGANKLERVKKGYYSTLLMSNVLSIIVGLTIVLFSKQLVAFFNPDSEVIRIGANYLVIVAPFYIIISTMFIANSVMRGAGDAIFPMISSLVSLWLARIPVAYILSKKIGSNGIWWSIPIGWCIGLAIVLIYYRTGKWKKKAIVKNSIPNSISEPESKETEAAIEINSDNH
jgi:putative MATE family efflux protein